MERFIKKTFYFLLILLLIDRSFIVFRINETNIFTDISIEKMRSISTDFFSTSKFDILIVGSSHAQFAVSPEIITNKTNISCLNIAYGDGANIGKQLKLLKKYIGKGEFKKPKLILFGMDVFAMNESPIYDDLFQNILFKKTDGISGFFDLRFFYSYFKLYARFIPRYFADLKSGKWILPFFRKDSSYDLSMFTKFEKYEISKYGWVQGYAVLNKAYLRYSKEIFKPDANAKNDLHEYIDLCKKNNISLIFFQAPEHVACLEYKKKYDDFDIFMNHVAHRHNLHYFNYNNVDVYPVVNDTLFFDSDHLNFKGAELFTELFTNDLIKYECFK